MKNELAAAFCDDCPLRPGHALVIPKRHESDYFRPEPSEEAAMIRLAHAVRGFIDAEFAPDGCNLGVNAGQAARLRSRPAGTSISI